MTLVSWIALPDWCSRRMLITSQCFCKGEIYFPWVKYYIKKHSVECRYCVSNDLCFQRLSFPFSLVITLFPDRVCILALCMSVLENGPVPLVSFSVKRSEIHNWRRKYLLLLIISTKLTTNSCFIN
jgi:hypothetical protein